MDRFMMVNGSMENQKVLELKRGLMKENTKDSGSKENLLEKA